MNSSSTVLSDETASDKAKSEATENYEGGCGCSLFHKKKCSHKKKGGRTK